MACKVVGGSLTFAPPLAVPGTTSGPEKATLKATLGSCTPGDGATITPTSASVSLVVHTDLGDACHSFAADMLLYPLRFTIDWKARPAIKPTVISFPAGDIELSSGDQGFTVGAGPGTSSGSGSYPGPTDFTGAVAQASTAPLNLLSGLCALGKPQKDIIFTGGTIGYLAF